MSMLLGMLAVTLVRSIMLLVGYLGNQSAFPQPLSPEEEGRYLELMAQGDDRARSILIEHNLRLVAHIVKKFDNAAEDPEDLISIGTIGLIKGVQTFDPSKGTRLATYAARCIENEILMHLRASRRLRQETSLQEPIGADRDGNEITLMDILQDEGDSIPEQVGQRFIAARLREKLARLSRRERAVLELRYGLRDGRRYTQREIADRMGISRSYVSRIEKKAVRRLVREMEQEEGDL